MNRLSLKQKLKDYFLEGLRGESSGTVYIVSIMNSIYQFKKPLLKIK